MIAVRSPWRWFPVAMLGSLGFVIAVNVSMVALALRSFPGAAGNDEFELGQVYDRVLQGASQQAALGWQIDVGVDAAGHVAVRLAGPDGAPLADAAVRIVAARPLGPAEERELRLQTGGAGVLRGLDALAPGQWSLAIDVTRGADRLTGTKRLVVR